jgi:hypothetical protein
MNFCIGKIQDLEPVQSGTSKLNKTWKKRLLILSIGTDASPLYQAYVLWTDLIDKADYKIGDKVKIEFDVLSRQYNNKWYTDLTAKKITVIEATKNIQEVINVDDQEDDFGEDLPF